MPVKSVNRQRKAIHFEGYETRKKEERTEMKETEQEREREQQLLSCKSPDTEGVTQP